MQRTRIDAAVDTTTTSKTVRKEYNSSGRPTGRVSESVSHDTLRGTEKTSTITWDGNGKRQFHNCDHVRTGTTRFAGAAEWGYRFVDPQGWTGWLSRFYHTHWQGALGSYDYLWYTEDRKKLPLPSIPDHPEQLLDWSKARERLLDDAFGLMPDDSSIAINVAEFTQLKNLVPSLAKSVKRILRYVRRDGNKTITRWKYLKDKSGRNIAWTGVRDQVKLNSLSWCLRDLAGAHLAISFGALPLADDLGNWLGKYFQVKAHLEWYKRLLNGKLHRVNAATPVVTTKSETPKGYNTWYCGPGPSHWEYTAKMVQELTIRGNLSAYVRVSPKSKAAQANAVLSQILGLNVPLQVAWDLVPFSFVVDWFFPVRDLIQKAEPRRALGGIASSIELRQHWHSFKVEAKCYSEWTGKFIPYQAEYHSGTWEGKKFTNFSTRYVRRMLWPSFNVLPKMHSHYGIKEVLLSGSLLVQRIFGRKKP